MSMAKDLAALKHLGVSVLRIRYAELFGEETRAGNKPWLVKRVAWRMQALIEGDLSERARRRAAELANDADLRLSPPRRTRATDQPNAVASLNVPQDERLPVPGTVLNRAYKGQMIQVLVLEKGFEYDGQVYRSLSAVAKTVSGTHCNGFYFFGLLKKGCDK